MEVLQLRHESFFDTFDGNFDNRLFRSRVKKFKLELSDTNLTIKIPLDFPEKYFTKTRDYYIPDQHYCIINPKEKITCDAQNPIQADAISLFLDSDSIVQVWHGLQRKNILEPIFSTEKKEDIPYFQEFPHPLKNNPLGKFLSILSTTDPNHWKSKDFYYTLIEHMIWSEQNHWRNIKNIPAVRMATKQEIYRRIKLARDKIHDNICANLSVTGIAELVYMTEYNFIRAFKSVYHMTPYQYILREKVRVAESLLQKNDLAIAAIAQHLNFGDQSTFGKCFRRVTGFTPSQYRGQCITNGSQH